MPLSNYQFSFNSLTFGAGTNYVINAIDGLGGMMPLRTQDDNKGYQDGTWSGRDFYDSRTITFQILITGDATHSAQYYYAQMQSAFAPQMLGYPSELKLFQFQLTADTGAKRMYGRVRGLDTIIDPEFGYGYILTSVTFLFPDPRYYDETELTTSGSSAVSVANAGWATTCPTITIASPSATSFSITDSVTGVVMAFSNVNTSYSVVIDLLNRTIQNNGYARNILSSATTDWLYVPGNTTGSWTSTGGSMSIAWRSAYV